MLRSDTAMHAIRILGVDAANLMSQVAVYRATAEELMEAANQIDVREWVPVDPGEADASVMKVTLPTHQQEAVMHILSLIDSLR